MRGCTDCTNKSTTLSKWGTYHAASGTITVNLSMLSATVDDQVFTFTDRLTSTGQVFDCPVTATSLMYDSVNTWGSASSYQKGPTPTITSCSATAVSGTITMPKGFAAVVSFPERVTDASQPSWSDEAAVTSNGRTWTHGAQASAFSGGGGASGQNRATPPTTPGPTVKPTGSGPTVKAGPSTPKPTAAGGVTPVPGSSSGAGVPTATAHGGTTGPRSAASATSMSARGHVPARAMPTRAAGPTLPRTGIEVAQAVGAALALVGGGTVLLVAARRHRYTGTHR